MVSLRNNDKGQFLIEGILLMVVIMTALTLFAKGMKDRKIVQGLVQKPWSIVSGMIETGNWKEPSVARKQHPNGLNHVLSLKCGDSGDDC